MERIEAIAFSMWLSKNSMRGLKDEYLNYWQYYDIFLTHEDREKYIFHAKNMEPGKNK